MCTAEKKLYHKEGITLIDSIYGCIILLTNSRKPLFVINLKKDYFRIKLAKKSDTFILNLIDDI